MSKIKRAWSRIVRASCRLVEAARFALSGIRWWIGSPPQSEEQRLPLHLLPNTGLWQTAALYRQGIFGIDLLLQRGIQPDVRQAINQTPFHPISETLFWDWLDQALLIQALGQTLGDPLDLQVLKNWLTGFEAAGIRSAGDLQDAAIHSFEEILVIVEELMMALGLYDPGQEPMPTAQIAQSLSTSLAQPSALDLITQIHNHYTPPTPRPVTCNL